MSNSHWLLNARLLPNEHRLPGFDRLLESWLNVHKKFCSSVYPEHSWEWDYKERSQVGFLSNAAALIGGIALQEWGTTKKSGYGRNDLWLRLRPPTDNEDYFVEAKQETIDLHVPLVDSMQVISLVMNRAIEDAQRLNPQTGKAAAISFFTLRFAAEKIDSLDQICLDLLDQIEKQNQGFITWDAMGAVWFRSEDFRVCRERRKEQYLNWKNNEVGIVLLAKVV